MWKRSEGCPLGCASHQVCDADVIIAGGQENMSQAPHALPNSRNGQRMGDWQMTDTKDKDGLWCFNDYYGITAENVADRYEPADEQDTFALRSQNLAEEAQAADVLRRCACGNSTA